MKNSDPKSPKSAQLEVETAVRLLRAGELPRLDKHCRKALETYFDEAELWKIWGICLGSLGRGLDARRCFRAAMEINPQDETSLANYITSCFLAGDTESAFSAVTLFFSGLRPESQAMIVDSLVEGLALGMLTWEEIPNEIRKILGAAMRKAG